WNDFEMETRRRRIMYRVARLALTSAACWIVLLRFVDIPRALPLITLTALGTCAILFYKRRRDREWVVRLLPLLMWSAFAFVLLAKMWLNTRIFHYGFFLALPATTIAIVTMFDLIPTAL